MAKLLLIDKINIPLENVHRIHGELKPRLAVNKYSKEITDHFESKNITIPSFDWIFLGIGNDGHIGSIFPYSSVLNSKYPTVTHSKNPYNDIDRITMTLPLINNSKRVTFIALGSAKAQILEKICELERRSKKYPAIYVDPSNGILEWYIDVEAGKCIESAHLL